MDMQFSKETANTSKSIHTTIPALFKAHILAPIKPANIFFDDTSTSFQDLDRSSNHVANFLLKHNIKHEAFVAVLMERSTDAISSQLGILKSGGAYVPLSPNDFPLARIISIFEDTQARFIISHKKHADLIEALQGTLNHQLTCLYIDEERFKNIPENTSAIKSVAIQPDSLAYVMYTSGSTGRPKGVMITHENIISSVTHTNYFSTCVSDAMLHAAPISFDAATFEIWGALLNGIDLYVIPEKVVHNFNDFSHYVRQHPITIAWLTSALFNLLADTQVDFFEHLQQLLVGGEALSPKHINRIRQRFPKLKLRNNYGPTEGTIFSTSFLIDQTYQDNIPIGSAITNRRVYVLDESFNIVGPNTPGELYIAGSGLARGYLNKPEETSQKFLDDPFHIGERMYATGDLCRYNTSGNIEYIGRTDEQVKIRGHRIELGEIEACLETISNVKKAVVLYRDISTKNKGLVAYIDCQDVDLPQIKTHIREQLPSYMIPNYFEQVDHFPITRNGKLDRKTLAMRPFAQHKITRHTEYQLTLQHTVLTACADSLDVDTLNSEISYFEQGGDSLSGTSLVIELEHLLNIDVPLYLLYEQPTVKDFVSKIVRLSEMTDDTNKDDITDIDLANDAQLDFTVNLEGRCTHHYDETSSAAMAIFLTGCTGFFGTFLLKELLSSTSANIYCLVRSKDEAHAIERIRASMHKYDIPLSDNECNRIIGIPGDLTHENLGIAQDAFISLNQTIDLIIHNGAVVNYVDAYHTLKKPNVLGTHEVIKLSCLDRLLPIHYVSSISVFETLGFFTGRKTIYEHENVDASKDLVKLGYSQSKWVAEKMMENARAIGLPINIYRSAYIMGHSKTGMSNTTDHIARYIAGCIEMGSAPILHEYASLTPVDQLSEAMRFIVLKEKTHGKTFHLCNPNFVTVDNIYQKIRQFGFPLELIPYDEWKERLKSEPKSNPLYPLLSLHIHTAPGHTLTLPELYENNARFDCHHFLDALEGSDISIDLSDPGIFERWLYNYLEAGLISEKTYHRVFPNVIPTQTETALSAFSA